MQIYKVSGQRCSYGLLFAVFYFFVILYFLARVSPCFIIEGLSQQEKRSVQDVAGTPDVLSSLTVLDYDSLILIGKCTWIKDG